MKRFVLILVLIAFSSFSWSQKSKEKISTFVSLDGGYSMPGLSVFLNSGVVFNKEHELVLGLGLNTTFTNYTGLYYGYRLGYHWWNESAKYPRLKFGIGPKFQHLFGENSSYFEMLLDNCLKVRLVKGLNFTTGIAVGLYSVYSSELIHRFNGSINLGFCYEF